MRKGLILCLFLIVPIKAICEEQLPVDITADEISYLQQEAKALAKGNVKLIYKEVTLYCDEAEYDSTTHVAHIKGNVRIVKENATVYGENIDFDFNTQNASMVNMRMESPPLYGHADQADKIGQDKYTLHNGYVTTCNLEQPHYRLIAKHITIFPKEKVVAKNMILKVGGVPVFYFPYYVHSLKDTSFPIQITPGQNSEWGKYVLGRWRYHLNNENRGKIHSDWYEKRGFGQGITHKMETAKFGEGLFNYYHIEDDLYRLEDRAELFEYYRERENLNPNYFEDDRYKAQASYSWQPTEKLSVKSEFHKFSDYYFMKDFFYREYEAEPQPLSYALVDYVFPYSSLALLTQKRVNNFFSQTEYLPQLEYDVLNQNLAHTNFYYRSKTTLGNLTLKRANSDVDWAVNRAHSHNVLSYAGKVKWLYLNPYVGSYTTFYSNTIFEEDSPSSRIAPEAGISLSTKLYKNMDTHFNFLGLKFEEMRHVLTPSVSYEYIRPPSISKTHLIQYDDVDGLDREEKIVFTLSNKLQAKNNDKVWDFIYFSPAVEYKIKRENEPGHFSTLISDLEIYPRSGLSFNSDAEYNFEDRRLKAINADLAIYDPTNKKYSVALGHRYLYGDSFQATYNLTYQLTSKLQFKNYLRYEYKTGEFQEQQYALRADLHCWWLDLGLDIDKQRESVREYTIWFAFVLKDFPDLHIGFDHTYKGAKESY